VPLLWSFAFTVDTIHKHDAPMALRLNLALPDLKKFTEDSKNGSGTSGPCEGNPRKVEVTKALAARHRFDSNCAPPKEL
jgi:hypothetical protein